MKKITLVAAIFAAFSMNAQIFSDNFDSETIDATTYTNWTSIDQDGDGNFWEVTDMLAFATGTSGATAHPMQTNAADSDSWEGTPFMPDNFLITTSQLDLTNVSGSMLSYQVGTYQVNGTFIADQYSIYLTDSNDPADIVAASPVLTRTVGDDAPSDQADGSASAADVTVDISAFDGQMVYLTFRHYESVDENSVIIDNVLVEGQLGTQDETFTQFVHFMDRDNILNLSTPRNMETIAITNALGQIVVTEKLNSSEATVNLASLKTGVYIASVSIEGQRKSFKIIRR